MEKAGFLLINKPKNISSYDCIRHLQRTLGKEIKIGHAGTLDPFAEGLLLVAINRDATKSINSLMLMEKEYIAKVKLGELTDTLDCTGTIIEAASSTSFPSDKKLSSILETFVGEYEQTPPIYSALKYEGVPLYKLARENIVSHQQMEQIVQEKTKKVMVHELNLLEYKKPFFTIKTTVSKGTYVRSLMNDIAKKLDTHATTYELCRTRIGPFHLHNAISLDLLNSVHVVAHSLIPYQIAESF